MSTQTITPEYLSIDDAAKALDCSRDTVRREISRGNLKAVRFGRLIRIRRADLDKAMRPVTNAHTLAGGDSRVA